MDDLDFPQLFRTYAGQVSQTLNSLELWTAFPELQGYVFEQLTDVDDWKLALPVIACLAAGGDQSDGSKVAAAWFPMYLASEIFDEVEDREFVPTAHIATPEIATNYATGLVFLSVHTLTHIHDPQKASRITRMFSGLGFDAVAGQHRDLAGAKLSVEAALQNYWETIILKAGSVVSMATGGGAAAGTSDESVVESLASYGLALGVMLQLMDDCRDAFYSTPNTQPRWEVSLPLLLYLLAIGEATISIPDVSTTDEWKQLLQEYDILEAISSILLEWKGHVIASVRQIKQPERQVLEKIPTLFLEAVASPAK